MSNAPAPGVRRGPSPNLASHAEAAVTAIEGLSLADSLSVLSSALMKPRYASNEILGYGDAEDNE